MNQMYVTCIRDYKEADHAVVKVCFQVAMRMPGLICSLSLDMTLKPRVELLLTDIGLPPDALPCIITRSAWPLCEQCVTHSLHSGA